MLKLSAVMIGSAKPKALVAFYEKVLGKAPGWEEVGWSGWQVGQAYFMVGEHSEVKGKAKEPQRVILTLETKKVKKEFKRIKELGAKVIREPYQIEDAWIATFADPDGNYFQLASPWDVNDKKK
jgi:predicted enzyme related to lactoylglutathione lyase